MREGYRDRYRYEGMRINKNIYSRLGTLVVPVFTRLTRKELDTLRRLNIELGDEDVEQISVLHLINSAVREINEAFEIVRQSGRIPFDRIRKNIIPIIVDMSQHTALNPILIHLEQHDDYTYRHSIGVALFARMIGRAKGLRGQDLLDLTISGFLHDVGKAKISPEILRKTEELTREEYEQIKRHTVYGYELIRNATGTSPRQAIVALQHHEREDGSGYPYALKGDEIDRYSKMVAVADVFHAMISKRMYKRSIPFYKALQEMSDYAYNKLEPAVTLGWIKRIMDLTIGNRVVLSNGSEGRIIMVSSDNPVHPLVEVNGRYIDLSREPEIALERII